MIIFEINQDGALGALSVTASNIEKHGADFCTILDQGVILATVTATVTTGTSTTSAAALSDNHKVATWLFHAAAVAEECVMKLTVATNDGQTLSYTVQYSVG